MRECHFELIIQFCQLGQNIIESVNANQAAAL